MYRLIILIALLPIFIASAPVALAAGTGATPAPQIATEKCPPPHEKEDCLKLANPLKGDTTDINDIIGNIIKGALGVMGSLTLLMLVYGGFQWLTSAGNAEKVSAGTQTMIWAVVGVAVVLASYLVLSTFTEYLTGAR